MKALRKDFYMQIRKNLNRYLSIMAIVALGVAFFAGITSSEPDMRYTADYFYDNNNIEPNPEMKHASHVSEHSSPKYAF